MQGMVLGRLETPDIQCHDLSQPQLTRDANQKKAELPEASPLKTTCHDPVEDRLRHAKTSRFKVH